MFLKLLLFEFHSPMSTLSPAEIEEELKALQDVPSRLSLYVEAESAGTKEKSGEEGRGWSRGGFSGFQFHVSGALGMCHTRWTGALSAPHEGLLTYCHS